MRFVSARQRRGGKQLIEDGSNIASVLQRIEREALPVKERIESYIAVVVPHLVSLNVKEDEDGTRRLAFEQRTPDGRPYTFQAVSMSDGTLRALGLLVALFQTGANENKPISLVGIEEPETSLHPAAVGALWDAMDEVSENRQILVTSHSDDLLDDERVTAEMLLAAVSEEGVTKIGPIDEASRSVLNDSLFTAGELLRINQLTPEYEESQGQETPETPLLEKSVA